MGGADLGTILEDRGSQITFSALGQEAPLDAKRAWDPTGEKKAALRDAVAPLLPDLEVRSGGSTSVDITLKGVDKAYGMKRLAEMTGIALEEMIFVGDRLDRRQRLSRQGPGRSLPGGERLAGHRCLRHLPGESDRL